MKLGDIRDMAQNMAIALKPAERQHTLENPFQHPFDFPIAARPLDNQKTVANTAVGFRTG